MSVVYTTHNLSATGPGEIKALPGADPLGRICIFCHTPHNAAPLTPLWNKALEPSTYDLYASSTVHVTPSQPTGPSRLCLSCHDGTLALGAVLRPVGGIATTGEITPARPSFIGTFLKDDHPVSFSFYGATANPEIAPSPPPDLTFYGPGYSVECSTCHDAHDDTYGKFLVTDNRNSALCTKCHVKSGWFLTTHATSPNIWNGVGADPWPRTPWLTVAENGCENCHAPHFAQSPERLLSCLTQTCNPFTEEGNCYVCHNGSVALKNIETQFQKLSRHPVEATTMGITPSHHEPNELPALITGHVECQDCHNPHAANGRTASAPSVSGRLDMVSGVDINGTALTPPSNYAVKEYEVCFKCHADSSFRVPFIPRVVNSANTRLEFDLFNPSYHPVVGTGRNPNVPSLNPPSQDSERPINLSASSVIYCTECHSDQSVAEGGSGSRGPHGSDYAPILRRRYETIMGTFESYENYRLCYRCHNQTSILSDQSFARHRLHIVVQNTPCSICHDPHGIRDDGLSGSHTHLINFDTRIVFPASGQSFPFFNDTGLFSGSCTLVCHGKTHNPLSYP